MFVEKSLKINFSKAEMVDLVFVLGASDKNCAKNRRKPNRRAFEKLMEHFETSGNVAYKKNEKTKRVFIDEN